MLIRSLEVKYVNQATEAKYVRPLRPSNTFKIEMKKSNRLLLASQLY